MKKISSLIFLLLAMSAKAQPDKGRLSQLFDSIKAKYPSYGLSIGVIDHNRAYYFAMGKTNAQTSINEHSIFEIGSLTKTFTGLLLAIAIEKQEISRNALIDEYMPANFHLKPGASHAVKVTDLASHQSGLPDFNDDRYIFDLFKANPEQPFLAVDSVYLYKVLGQVDSLDGHGKYRYNNFGFALLGQVLQQAAKKPYSVLLTEQILQPLHLRFTSLNAATGLPMAGLYDEDGNKKQPLNISVMKPAGGLHSNAEDMVSFLRYQLNPDSSPFAKAIALSHQPFYADASLKVGFGWEMQKGYVEKTGDTWGNSSILCFDPVAKTGIVVLCDHHNSQLVQDIASVFLNSLKK